MLLLSSVCVNSHRLGAVSQPLVDGKRERERDRQSKNGHKRLDSMEIVRVEEKQKIKWRKKVGAYGAEKKDEVQGQKWGECQRRSCSFSGVTACSGANGGNGSSVPRSSVLGSFFIYSMKRLFSSCVRKLVRCVRARRSTFFWLMLLISGAFFPFFLFCV